MKMRLVSVVAVSVVALSLVFSAGLFGQSPPTAPATSRVAIPAKAGEKFDLAWIGKIVRVSDPQIAPDGKSLAVVVVRNDYDEDLNVSELALVDTATGKTRSLTHGRKTASFPRWSPMGDRLAFLAGDAEKHNQIFVLDMAGGDAEQVTKSPTSIQQFAWKPDGTAFAYAAIDEAPKLKDADKFDDAFEVGNGSFLDREKALPTHLWLIGAEGREAKRLTQGAWSLPVAFPPGPPASPIAFTPDGTKLIYVRLENTYSGDRKYSSPQVLDLATGKSEAITTHTTWAGFPVISPDGAHVAYLYLRDGVERNYEDIYVVNGLKGDGANITQAIDRNFYRALWTPDSKAILTGANDGATAALWLQPLDGKAARLDLNGVTPNTGYWLDVNVGAQGQIAFAGTEPHRPAEIYLIDSPTAKPRRLTTFNAAFDDGLKLGKSDVVTWQSPDKAPKNWTENGILTYPPDYAPGKKLPLVLYIHGGPNSASKDTFSTFAQLIAAQGWLVFEPNYRGSDNYGNDFFRAIIDDSGDGPGRDVFAGLDMLKKRGIVDENNIAVTGWSYGGYMTTWLMGHAQFWKAAIAGAPVTNLLDQYNLSDANVARAGAIGGSPYTGDWMKHWVEQSPITYYDKMVTPTLVLQDVGDYRVTITQGYELYHSLKDRGVKTYFYAYPIGGHSPADPVRMRDVYRRWIEWLGEYLPRN
ncbi:S9 family peptidase [Terracidiphilus sp.]|jgi:dipeptidyl aminopeptidase/acylaminoacyl peptidase|uniref:S9 family peptidase n=1 Tax=Terracidiphilus sp. TaxID=1964191 RepID=UPI003C27754A